MDEEKRKNCLKKIEERGIDKHTVLFASFIGGFDKFGLNQGEVLLVSKNAGEKLAHYYDVYGKSAGHDIKSVIEFLNGELAVSRNTVVEESNDFITVKIETGSCRYCPIAVGDAELKGTACPFPGLIEGFVNRALQKKAIEYERLSGVKKDGTYCNMKFKKI